MDNRHHLPFRSARALAPRLIAAGAANCARAAAHCAAIVETDWGKPRHGAPRVLLDDERTREEVGRRESDGAKRGEDLQL